MNLAAALRRTASLALAIASILVVPSGHAATASAIASRRASAARPVAMGRMQTAPLAADPSTMAAALDLPPASVVSSSVEGVPQAYAVLPSLGVIHPRAGNNFVLLSTGIEETEPEPGTDHSPLGSDGDTVRWTLVVNVPAGANRMHLDYNFLSAEYPEWVGTEFNDAFQLQISDTLGNRIAVEETVNSSNFYAASATRAGGTHFDIFTFDPDGVNADFPGGLPDAGLTGWRSLDTLVGTSQTVTLTFTIADVGDGILDSAVILDNLSFSSIEAVDPNPSLISGGQVVTDVARLAAGSRPVIRAAADGVTRVLLRTSPEADGNVTFSLDGGVAPEDGGLAAVGSSGRALSVTVPVVNTANGRRAFALYQVPDEFNRGGDSALGERTVRIKAHFVPATGTPTDGTFDLRLERPPVVLLHGLWSGASIWTMPLLDDNRFAVTLGDYAPTSSSSFATNAAVPANAIHAALERMREDGGAVTQVDFAGHSVGGILARKHAGQTAYKRSSNYNAGDIHKLLTVNAPHAGTPLGNLLVTLKATPVVGSLVSDATRTLDMPVDQGAMDDIAHGSAALSAITATTVPSHALIGTGGSDPLDAAPEPLGSFYRVLSFFGSTSGLFQALPHDDVVDRDSQGGGIAATAQTQFGGPDSVHMKAPTSAAYSTRIAELLNSAASGAAFGTFPAVASLGQSVTSMENRVTVNATVSSGVTITSPANGAGVVTGSSVSVSLSVPQGVTSVLLVGPGMAQIDAVAPFEFTFTVPAAAIGPYAIQAIATDGQAHYFTSNLVTLNVTTAAALQSVRILPQDPILFGAGATRQVLVMGHYSDGVDRDITDPAVGTVYQVSETPISTVSASGLVTAVKLGTTTLIASLAGKQDSVSVTVVQPETVLRGDANGDSALTPADIFYLINSFFAGGPAPSGDADANGDGQVTPADVFYLINYLFAGGPAPH